MPHINNPAGRLYKILDKLRKHPEKMPIGEAWTMVFQVHPKEGQDVLLLIYEVLKLVEETKYQVSKLDVDHKLFMKPFIEIQKIFTLGFNQTISHVQACLTDATMLGLEYCDERLRSLYAEKPPNPDDLSSLLNSVDTLLTEVTETELPQQLKILLQESLNQIKQAILHYEIHGAKGLKDALDKAFGSWIFYRTHGYEKPDETAKDVIKKYGTIIAFGLSLVADTYAVAQLTAEIAPYFALLQP